MDAAPPLDDGPKGNWRAESGKIIALREQTDLYLDEARGDEIDEILERARAVDSGHGQIRFSSMRALPAQMLDAVSLTTTDSSIEERWDAGEPLTGNEELDLFLQSLEPGGIRRTILNYFELRFARWVKIETLVARLEEFEHMQAWERPYGDGDDILLAEEADGSLVRFIVKWGDCPSGCIWSHWWEVRVPRDPSLAAALVGEGGDPVPANVIRE